MGLREEAYRNGGVVLEDAEQIAEEGFADPEEYYPQSAQGDESELYEEGYTKYYGRNVIWLGYEGEMFRAKPEYIEAIEGNIFDADKLASVVELVIDHPDRVPIVAPLADVIRITPQTVEESIEYAEEGGHIYTTGDEELDLFLVDPEEALALYSDLGDEEDYESEEAYKEDRADALKAFEIDLASAVERGDGDLGSFHVQIRDGNHRTFGALLAGEPYVYVHIISWTMQDVRDGKKPELAEELI
jgi:hypothetical protein